MNRRSFLTGLAMTAASREVLSATPRPDELLVVDQRNHALLIVDPINGLVETSIELGVNGHEVAMSADQSRAYVTIYSDASLGQAGKNGSTIDVIDLDRRQRVASLEVGPVRPHGLGCLRDGRILFTAELRNAVGVIDPERPGAITWIPTQRSQSHMLVHSEPLDRVFTANVDSGSISVIDLGAGTLRTVIDVAPKIQRVSLSVDGLTVYTHDLSQRRLLMIDAREPKVTGEIALPGFGYASASPRSDTLLIALPFGEATFGTRGVPGTVCFVDLVAGKVAHVLPMRGLPSAILLSPDGGRAFVSLYDTGEIVEIDTRSAQELRRIKLQPGADGMAFRSVRS
jgi:sugar lactone lactonase YvrE